MSCWSLESPLSFMPAAGGRAQAEIAGVAEPHAHRLRPPEPRLCRRPPDCIGCFH